MALGERAIAARLPWNSLAKQSRKLRMTEQKMSLLGGEAAELTFIPAPTPHQPGCGAPWTARRLSSWCSAASLS